MVKKRDIKLSNYNISKIKYLELKNFCLQYGEKKREIHSNYGISAINYDDMPKGSSTSNPTEQTAMKNLRLQKDIELIEQTAIEADAEIYQWLLKAITQKMRWEDMDIPMGRRRFYETRRYFFYLLAQKK